MTKSTTGNGNSDEDAMLHQLQRETFEYFVKESNLANGLVKDKSQKGSPASIAATGLALSAYPVGVERSFMSRAHAVERTLATLRFFWNSKQGTGMEATGHHGFYYHFLSMQTGRRVWKCELSTIDTALLLAGALLAASYYDRNNSEEREIRDLADGLYLRADWQWAQAGKSAVSHGWKPGQGRGFLKYRWQGYNEALLLNILGLGSPAHPLPEESYAAWTSGFRWEDHFGYRYLYAGPLFIHQLPQVWLDLRGIQDRYMREKSSDYFENSRRATLVQQQYAIQNPQKFARYSGHCWGITASDGPGDATRHLDGVRRRFFGYRARGVPRGPDDGTISPWAAVDVTPFRARGRFAHYAALRPFAPSREYAIWLQGLVQSDVERQGKCQWLGKSVALRHKSRARGADDRELPNRPHLEVDAKMSLHRRRIAPSRFPVARHSCCHRDRSGSSAFNRRREGAIRALSTWIDGNRCAQKSTATL